MTSGPYLLRLAERLQRGAGALPEAQRARHAAFLLGAQAPDGGFPGRAGDSDLYYTSFAVRGLHLLGALEAPVAERVAGSLRGRRLDRLNVIDAMNWLSTAALLQLSAGVDLLEEQPAGWDDEIVARIESLRRPDGGYAKAPEGAAGSTYHSFLAVLACELLGRSVPEPDRLIGYLRARRRPDGGFVEIAPMKNSGANPTAAAAALLHLLGALEADERRALVEFFDALRSDEGGFRANQRIPFADGLSTFTSVLSLLDLGAVETADLPRVRRFAVRELESPQGGFRAAAWDDAVDVEYTFYGLGLAALTAGTP